MNKPFSQACENNKEPILALLQRYFADLTSVLEIGSGTGQHAVFFAQQLPHLIWQCSDRHENHAGITQWITDAQLDNVKPPVDLDVSTSEWPDLEVDAAFSANTAHIMSWPVAQDMLTGVARILPAGGIFCLYGPFNYGGNFSSDSNARFDQWLKSQSPEMGIRDFESVCEIAGTRGLQFIEDNEMPANNRLLVFRKD